MSNPELPKFAELETLRQLPKEQLVSIIVQQQGVIEQQQKVIEELLRRYSVWKPAVRDFTGGLPKIKLQQAMEYIHDHLTEDLSLREIATRLQMSPNYFTSLFKQSTGLSTHQYVIQCRIEKAKQLLTKPNLPIVEVSQQVGFQSQSHFINVFRKRTGMTPKTYREARK